LLLLLEYVLIHGKQYAVLCECQPIHAVCTATSRVRGNRVYNRTRAWKQIHQRGVVLCLCHVRTRTVKGFRSGDHTLLPTHRAFRQFKALPVPDTGAGTVSRIAAPARRILQIRVLVVGALDEVCRTRTAGVPTPETMRVCHLVSVLVGGTKVLSVSCNIRRRSCIPLRRSTRRTLSSYSCLLRTSSSSWRWRLRSRERCAANRLRNVRDWAAIAGSTGGASLRLRPGFEDVRESRSSGDKSGEDSIEDSLDAGGEMRCGATVSGCLDTEAISVSYGRSDKSS